ncbi:hypothetical protein GPECTOR_91g580 [Gonium pectorale]|uniref:Uncharacterized protein n=1 Tax=Gonium pectorale TaxID=33097 RepID=A0A150G0M2_GONPE|nr:hypothetical protein GPECTOR_91g580 [Gonium pectorale]|eukprot:KXZ43426.1 hypothetical protein GPECTOR_91g580 [Gonium pectorale]
MASSVGKPEALVIPNPFDALLQQSSQHPHPPPPAYGADGAEGGRRPQHPLDFGFGPDDPSADPDRAASHAAASSAGRAGGGGGGGGSLPSSLGSFSDLFAPVANLLGAGTAAAAPSGGGGGGGLHGHGHSSSVNGIEDLLERQRAARDAAAGAAPAGALAGPVAGARPASAAAYQVAWVRPPGVAQAHRGRVPGGPGGGAPPAFDPFSPLPATATSSSSAPAPASPLAAADGPSASAAIVAAEAGADGSGSGGGGEGGGEGYSMGSRELLLYALPLFKERLVFLPVVNWQDVPDTSRPP